MIQKGKKELRLSVMLDERDVKALQYCMDRAGETNMSSYIRRLIYDKQAVLSSAPSFRTM